VTLRTIEKKKPTWVQMKPERGELLIQGRACAYQDVGEKRWYKLGEEVKKTGLDQKVRSSKKKGQQGRGRSFRKD